MAFRNKASLILAYEPDILVIQECEHPDKLIFPTGVLQPTDVLWFGKNKNKGLSILSYGNFHLTLIENYNPAFQLIVPVSVTIGQLTFKLLAIWANNPDDTDGKYVEQIWKAIHHYDSLLTPSKTMLVGDFNSNTIWDRKRRPGNHSNVVKLLETKGIYSAYHSYHDQKQGAEQHPTFYLYRHKNKTYHLDYCFMSADMTENLHLVEIGDYNAWITYSDHVPLIVTLKDF